MLRRLLIVAFLALLPAFLPRPARCQTGSEGTTSQPTFAKVGAKEIGSNKDRALRTDAQGRLILAPALGTYQARKWLSVLDNAASNGGVALGYRDSSAIYNTAGWRRMALVLYWLLKDTTGVAGCVGGLRSLAVGIKVQSHVVQSTDSTTTTGWLRCRAPVPAAGVGNAQVSDTLTLQTAGAGSGLTSALGQGGTTKITADPDELVVVLDMQKQGAITWGAGGFRHSYITLDSQCGPFAAELTSIRVRPLWAVTTAGVTCGTYTPTLRYRVDLIELP